MKPGVFTQLYVQLVFSPANRECLILEKYKNDLYSYMGGIINNLGHKSIKINGMSDHIHILIGLNPKQAISELVRDLKRSSSLYINEKKWYNTKFRWQEGYGGFSYGRSQLDSVCKYIENQQIHHKKSSFRQEYIGLLEKFQIDFSENYLFHFFELYS